MSEDTDRQQRLDKMIAETEAGIAEALQAQAKIDALIEGMGFGTTQEVLRKARDGSCSPALQQMLDEDLAQFHRELAESEAALMGETARAQAPKPRRKPRRMTRI